MRPGTSNHCGQSSASRHSRRWSWLAVASALLLGACTTPLDPRRDAGYQETAYTADRPVTRPVRSISSFSDSLMCMDEMLRAAQLPTTLITSKQFTDYSTRVPVGIKEMIITALSQMSRRSNAFRYVDYEVDIVRQDTVQNLTTILLNNNLMQLQRPALYVSGAVAFVDQNVLTNRNDAGLSGPRIDLGVSRNSSATVIGLEMHLGDFRTRTLIPGLDSANEVVIGGGSQGLDLAGRIGTYGVTFNVGRDYALGAGGAMRTLVDLAAIELVGKWARVPYWQCLTLDQTHPDFQRQMREWFMDSGGVAQARLIQSSLVAQGYLPPGSEVLDMSSPDLRDALGRFQADNGILPTGTMDFKTYERALSHFVTLDNSGRLQQVGWSTSGPGGTAAVAKGAPGYLPVKGKAFELNAQTAPERVIDLKIKNPMLPGSSPTFEVGEQVFAAATVSRASHVYCFFNDAVGNVMRLTPNNVNPNSLQSANQVLRLPDWLVPNPAFIMDASQPGTERLACLATDKDVMDRLPAPLQGTGVVNIPGYRSIEDVENAFSHALGDEPVSKAEVQWKVIPKKAPPVQSQPTAAKAAPNA
ncbi:DUF4384 domain-containing protein [Diaphorobacter ruginosibacter]|uniref:DUF4384 domain-containing protein n=1 Tax=Diaphorobacter ruginosibacter TaxID=1715720 RepID=A0A7G9RTU5_9BURK|nr:DUF4384 domain-containing protein [Diaphorobacter ruginosibacter]QNN59020.1 DUF4384 domain-containing protein [Diaphorobacter ruginosibacter]